MSNYIVTFPFSISPSFSLFFFKRNNLQKNKSKIIKKIFPTFFLPKNIYQNLVIMTLTNNPGFKLTDDYEMYKPSAEREERVRAGIRISHQKSYGFNIKCFRYTVLKFCNFSDNSYFTWKQFLWVLSLKICYFDSFSTWF